MNISGAFIFVCFFVFVFVFLSQDWRKVLKLEKFHSIKQLLKYLNHFLHTKSFSCRCKAERHPCPLKIM
jgi:hypothetical protein